MDKRKSERGETLVESLAAILIFTFASIAMLTMFSAAADINQRVRQADERNRQWQIAGELAAGARTEGNVRIQLGEKRQTVQVAVFGNQDEGYVFMQEDGT